MTDDDQRLLEFVRRGQAAQAACDEVTRPIVDALAASIVKKLREDEDAMPDCDCRTPSCGHKASKHVGAAGACVVPDCRCGPGGWS